MRITFLSMCDVYVYVTYIGYHLANDCADALTRRCTYVYIYLYILYYIYIYYIYIYVYKFLHLGSPLLMNVYKREIKGKELPRAVADRIAIASNRNLRKALLMLESCYVRHGHLEEGVEPVMAGLLLLRLSATIKVYINRYSIDMYMCMYV